MAKVMRTFRSAGPIVANEKKTGTLSKKTSKEGRTEKKETENRGNRSQKKQTRQAGRQDEVVKK